MPRTASQISGPPAIDDDEMSDDEAAPPAARPIESTPSAAPTPTFGAAPEERRPAGAPPPAAGRRASARGERARRVSEVEPRVVCTLAGSMSRSGSIGLTSDHVLISPCSDPVLDVSPCGSHLGLWSLEAHA